MNKKLIALAVAAAFAAPAAMADVIVYGKVHTDIRATDSDTTDNWTVNSNASRLGFKGSEDLGNGLKAIWKYEMTYDVDGANDANSATGNGITGARNSYLGLMGDFGTFLVGRHDTPAKMAYYAAGNDHLGDSIIDFNNLAGQGSFTEVRANNAIGYVSPNWDGFKFAAAVTPGEQAGIGSAADSQDDSIADNYSLGLMYAGNGFKVGAGYEGLADANDDNDTKMLQVGGSYTFNNVTVGAQYENTDDYSNTDGGEKTTWGLAAKAKFGNNAVIANYVDLEIEDTTNADEDSEGFGLAFQHTMSKRTSVYVAYNNQDSDDNDTDRFAVGMIHNF